MWGVCIFVILFVCQGVYADNNDIVVLVHGLASDASTWEYEPEILQSGLRTITLNVNPFESRYDRAMSLFAQLKGTRINYGACHAREFNHLQFGEDYTGRGLYPEWDENHKVHFIGHSLGGLTVTTLERIMELGNDCEEDTDPLFQGGNSWITSVTTLASPHDGTTASDQVPLGADELAFNLLVRFGSETAELSFPQFGLYPEEGENNRKYFSRLKKSGLFTQKDFSFYDLSLPGAAEFNNAGPGVANKDTYYFAYALDRTSPSEDCFLFFFSCDPVEDPDRGMLFLLKSTASIIGSKSEAEDRANDGAVNKQRARCPEEDKSKCRQVQVDTVSWVPGQWHYVDVGYLDHFQVTWRDDRADNNNFQESAKRIYLQHSLRLKSLPSTSVRTLSAEEELRTRNMADDVALYLEAMNVLTTPFEVQKEGISNGGAITLLIFVGCAVLTIGFFVNKKVNVLSQISTGFASQREGSARDATL